MDPQDRSPDRLGGGLARRPRGQGLVEMAIVSMLLLTLVIGIIDFGFLWYRHVQAANCVREAARRAVVAAVPPEAPYCLDAGLMPVLTVSGSDQVATVNVTHDWIALDLFIPGLPNPTIYARTAMRTES